MNTTYLDYFNFHPPKQNDIPKTQYANNFFKARLNSLSPKQPPIKYNLLEKAGDWGDIATFRPRIRGPLFMAYLDFSSLLRFHYLSY